MIADWPEAAWSQNHQEVAGGTDFTRARDRSDDKIGIARFAAGQSAIGIWQLAIILLVHKGRHFQVLTIGRDRNRSALAGG